MKYYTYKIDFSNNLNEGTVPSNIDGGFEYEPFRLVGYSLNSLNLVDLEKWEVSEITQEEAINFALKINPDMSLNENGRISAPSTPVINSPL